MKEFFYKSSTVAEMGNRLDTTDIGRKVGGCFAHFRGGMGSESHLTPVAWAEAYLPTKWHFDPFSRLVTTDMGRKLGVCPLLGEAGSPSNTMWPGPRPTSIPSGIVIHPTV